MKLIINDKKKKLLKKDVIICRVGILIVCGLFAAFYLCIRLFELLFLYRYIFIEFYIGFIILVFCLLGIIYNIFYINHVFKRDYSNNPTIIDYSSHKNYLLINNVSINKKTKIYNNTVKHIFYKSNCVIVLTNDRHMYMIPNEINIDVLKKNANTL